MESGLVAIDELDPPSYPHPAESDFSKLADIALTRRGFLGRGAALGVAAFVMGTTALTPFTARADSRFGFDAVAANGLDTVTVPNGHNWQVVTRWGDPLWSRGAPFDQNTRGTGASQELAVGDNTDGMAMFADRGHTVLAANNEYINWRFFHKFGRPDTPDEIRKSMAAHGVTVAELKHEGKDWSIVIDSPYNRRITADTPIEITGPARSHDWLKTAADPGGTSARGTFNNCGNGRTPWGTYLTCEENFHAYFSSSDAKFKLPAAFKRYGVGRQSPYGWATLDERFDVAKHPNEPNRHGYIVEIDPLDPTSTPKKRTALGRFKHENAEVVLAANGQVIVFMGDDEQGEFLYKFVSDGRYVEGGNNRDLLDSGNLYVAKFSGGGTGEWAELSPQTTGMASQAEICIHTRMAASKVGATTMDRPEWVSANPRKVEAYCCLTNNRNRGRRPNAGGDATPVGGPTLARPINTVKSCAGRHGTAIIPTPSSGLGPVRCGGQPSGPQRRQWRQ